MSEPVSPQSSDHDYGAAALDLHLTTELSRYLCSVRDEDLPDSVTEAARRGVLDWLGCAIAGCALPGPAILYETLRGADRRATAIGRSHGLAPRDAASFNGTAGHVLDFDDTHMGGVILHASSPALAALFALAAEHKISGKTLVRAYALAFDAAVRLGQAAPDHHDGGWHLTGTLGTIGAAVASAVAMGLGQTQMACAIGIAATQAAGMQQHRGTMTKSFHAGRAASNGLLAAQLAAKGFDASLESLEGKRGFVRIYSRSCRPEALTEGLGTRWEILANGFKPYACGVVLHPAIDAMIALHRELQTAEVQSLTLWVNPAALRITGVVAPESRLKSKFSLTHAAAVALLDGQGGIAQFGTARAQAPDVAQMAARILPVVDPGLARDQARAEARLACGRLIRAEIAHATGTKDNPMSNAALEAKFLSNAQVHFAPHRAQAIRTAAWRIADCADAAELLGLLAQRDEVRT